MPRIYILTTLLFLGWMLQAQDPSFSQFYANRIYLNPALTGLEQGVSFAGVYRQQWKNVDSGFKTYLATIEIQEPFIRSGFGLSLYQDVQGLMQLKTSSVGLSYAYTLPMNEHNVHIGMQALWYQRSVDWSKLIFSDQLDPVFGDIYPTTALPGADKVSYADFNVGAIWRFDASFRLGKKNLRNTRNSLGLSLHHVPYIFKNTNGNESLQSLNTRTTPRLTLHAGSIIPMILLAGGKQNISFSPNIKYDLQGRELGNFKENLQVVTYGCYVLYEGIYFGAFYQNKFLISKFKHTNALILTMGAHIDSGRKQKNKYFIGFSYDANTTGVGTQAGGVYELAFRVTFSEAPTLFGSAGKPSSKKSLDCYHFY